MTVPAVPEISVERAALLDRYGALFGIVDPRKLPGLAGKTDSWLAEKLGIFEDLQGKIRRARAAGGIERLRTRQAAVTASVDVCRDWLRGAFSRWSAVEDADAFDPFHAAVELYGRPSLGLYAAFERMGSREGAVFIAATMVLADEPSPRKGREFEEFLALVKQIETTTLADA